MVRYLNVTKIVGNPLWCVLFCFRKSYIFTVYKSFNLYLNHFKYLHILELLITAGGENIPPVLIEDKVKEVLPFISNCQLIGDKKKFLSMLLTMKVDVNPDTMEPYDRLAPLAKEWCMENGSAATSVTSIIDNRDEVVLRYVYVQGK